MNAKLFGYIMGSVAVITLLWIFILHPILNSQSSIPNSDNLYTIDSGDMYSINPTSTDSIANLTQNETDWLIHMREEEKLARDVYMTLGTKWNLKIFSNISASEQTHTDAIKRLLERYKIQDPSKDDAVGVFTLPEMKNLYVNLVGKGNISELDALVVGATIEDLDISDLDKALSETTNPAIVTVYKNLQKGSRNHMRAFTRNIESRGGTYVQQYITTDTYNTIINSPQERGRLE